jgi:hypothetical protein
MDIEIGLTQSGYRMRRGQSCVWRNSGGTTPR